MNIIAGLITAGLISNVINYAPMVKTEQELKDKYEQSVIYEDLHNDEIMASDTYIIEKNIGICNTSDTKEGTLFQDGSYINYSNLSYISAGDVVITYLVYNDTSFCDDVVERVDIILR